ncbi:Disease resistance protein RPP13 [Abeliophyllum distichum]|uniref:Disease resistance protein RPP13 n=1 Tax=Abeliophyllum distichum TaxID=126358 RepID=A0ABD1V6J0_9LAMI
MTERGREIAPSTYNLRRLLEYRFKNERLEMFDGQRQLVLILAQFLIKFCSDDDEVIALLKRLDNSAMLCWGYSRHSEEYRNFSTLFRSFMAELQVFFQVRNSKCSLSPNELVAVFIDLFLEILEDILRLQPNFILRLKDSIQTLKLELKFLITFLGDTPSQPIELETTKNVLADIEAVANDVGSFLYSFFFVTDRISVTAMTRTLSDLLGNVELVKDKIREHCITVAKILPSGMTPKTAVVSLFLVDSILDDLKDLMNQKDDRIASVKDQIQTIHQELMFLRSFLADMKAGRQHLELEDYFIQIRDIAYEVEYVVSSFAPVWYRTIRLPQVMEKINLIRIRLQEMKKKHDAGMLKDAESPSQQISLQDQRAHIGHKYFVGLEDEATKIKTQLIGGNQNLEIISIFGMPGLGKTTLAKELYHDPWIVQKFDKRAWCVVSQTYRTRNILIDILTSMNELNKDAIMDMDDDTLGQKLHKSLSGRKYIVVMDDIWNVKAWHDIENYFPKNNKESRLLFTTRNKDVGTEASAFVHPLKPLTKEECWYLLQKKVFHEEPCPKELMDVGKEIARNCDGLPLAVVVIAAVLANMEKKRELWKDVAERLSSHISKESNMYIDKLQLSYNYLPMHLKPCFLYFGAFEEDREIAVRKLILLWVSEGFIEKLEHRSSEDVAQEYLTDLINRGLVMVAKRRSDGGVKACNVHDLLRDMCLRIAEKDNFLKVIQNQLSIYEQHQRLSFHSPSIPSFSRPFGLHVHSVLGNLPDPSTFFFSNLKLLKVLDLSTIDFTLYNPTRMEALLLLRFLTVSSITSSIEILENLEFLFVENREVVEIPENLFKMVKLRHVHFRGGAQFSKSWSMRATKDEMFHGSNLQKVSSISIYDESDEKILRYSPSLRRLKCRVAVFWDSSEKNYRYPAFNFLNQLESLSVSFRRSYVIEDPNPDLTNLPLNLRRLTLRNFNLSWKQMKIIEELPKLEVLKLRNGTIEEKQWDTSEGEFKKLIYLELDGVQIEEWNASSDHFPKLERLVLRSCHHFGIPSDLGYCQCLLKIEVQGCAKSIEDSALTIKEDQEDYRDDLEVIISHS